MCFWNLRVTKDRFVFVRKILNRQADVFSQKIKRTHKANTLLRWIWQTAVKAR